MRIENLQAPLLHSLMAALPKVASGFSVGEGEAPAAPAPLPPGAGAGTTQALNPSVAMLVTLAAADPMIERRRKQAVDAQRGIDMLDQLHRELVAGVVSPARLQAIVEWSETFERTDDPALAAILSDIELRVRVELAKLDLKA
ncbi:MAG: flagellar trans-acting factor FliX [Sphingomonas sp.]|uniref:flagellar assembly protein FliX n=1 Tax=unclassified Sphingomonas TaxID=196159 RepID=UPI0024569A98|nr:MULTISPECIES: flagellar assembly protein FliX [unclassified Sphingomonas]MBQ1496855.1 flagellar trans-acting factor FliX [Sphingomonas sp.]MDH4743505.1 flagellar trans-acting factor FliX [Sphingomonas sp. CBMAI 2297]